MAHIYWAVHKGAKHITKHAYHRSHGDLENFKHAKLEDFGVEQLGPILKANVIHVE